MSNGLSWHYAVKDGRVVDNKFKQNENETTLQHTELKEPNEKKESIFYENGAE